MFDFKDKERIAEIERIVDKAYHEGDVKRVTSNLFGDGEGPVSNPYAIDAEDIIKEVLKNIPELCEFGVERGGEAFESRARPFLNDVDGFLISVNWIIHNLSRKKTMNLGISSYGLKHLMELDVGRYVANGIFICAMMAERYDGRIDYPNMNFNISEKSLKGIRRRLR